MQSFSTHTLVADQASDVQDVPPWTLLHAVRGIARAWDSVTANTISNCWRSAGFGDTSIIETEELVEVPTLQDLLIKEMAQLNQYIPDASSHAESYVKCDSHVMTHNCSEDEEDEDEVNLDSSSTSTFPPYKE